MIKLLEETIREKLHDTGYENDFLDMTLKANFCASEYTSKSEKATYRVGEHICKSYI